MSTTHIGGEFIELQGQVLEPKFKYVLITAWSSVGRP